MQSLSRVTDNRIELSNVIEAKQTYTIIPAQSKQAILTKYGDDLIKDSGIKPRTEKRKKVYSWVDFLNSGYLPFPGTVYKIIKLVDGDALPVLVYQGVSSSGGELQLSDGGEPNMAKAMIQPSYNPITEKANFRTFADTLQYQNNQTIQLLQDELRQKDALIQEFSSRGEVAYEQFSERENRMAEEREKLIRENLILQKEIESLRRELEIEKLRNSIEREYRERELKLERKLDRIENSKTDWGKTLRDAAPLLSGILPLVSNGKVPAMPMMAGANDEYEDDYSDEQESNDNENS